MLPSLVEDIFEQRILEQMAAYRSGRQLGRLGCPSEPRSVQSRREEKLRIWEKVRDVWGALGAGAAIAGVVLLVTLEKDDIAKWETWDRWRVKEEGATVLVAELEHDQEGERTQEVVDWLEETGKIVSKLGRRWNVQHEVSDEKASRRKALDEYKTLILITGHIAGHKTKLEIWPAGRKGEQRVTIVNGEVDRAEETIGELERTMARVLTVQAWENAKRIGEDLVYDALTDRIKEVRRQMESNGGKSELDFMRAYVERQRAEITGDGEAWRRASNLYRRALDATGQSAEQLLIKADFGEATALKGRSTEDTKAVTDGIRLLVEAEREADAAANIEIWAAVRNNQTASELWLLEKGAAILELGRLENRQWTTWVDTRGVVSAGTSARTAELWQETRRRMGREDDGSCNVTWEGGQDEEETMACRQQGNVGDSTETYQDRRERLEGWIDRWREEGRRAEVLLVGLRSDLLREEGIIRLAPHLLIESFEGTNEFRTKYGIVDRKIDERELELGIPSVLKMVETEVQLALVCAEGLYQRTLLREVGKAKIWCPRGPAALCNDRIEWHKAMTQAVGYAISGLLFGDEYSVDEPRIQDERRLGTWQELGSWARKRNNNGKDHQDLCPNRPQGIAEENDVRGNDAIIELTERYRDVLAEAEGCRLPAKRWIGMQQLPAMGQETKGWRQKVTEWIEQERANLIEDMESLKRCTGDAS